MPNLSSDSSAIYDIIIVGAGPAGLSTALHLAQAAPHLIPRTLILEKARHPRPKLCGGGILPDGEVILNRLGLDLSEIPHVDVSWAHFDFDASGLAMRARDDAPYAFRCIQRDEFDAWLAEHARRRGFTIHEDTNVQNLTVGKEYVEVGTNRGPYRARVVVGADGSNSLVRRVIAPHGSSKVARLLEVYTPVDPQSSAHRTTDSYFDFICIPDGVSGYVWDFPALVKGQPMRNRGVYDWGHIRRSRRKPLKQVLSEELQRHGQNLDEYPLAGHPIRWFNARGTFCAPRVILVGDAAGVDPLYGEGISLSLGYGKIAAEALREAFERGDFSFNGYRQRVLRDPLGIVLRRRVFFSQLIYRITSPVMQAFIWRKLGGVIKWLVQTFLIDWAKRQPSL